MDQKSKLIEEILKINNWLRKESLINNTEQYLSMYLEQLKINKTIDEIEDENRNLEDKLKKNTRKLKELYIKQGEIMGKFEFVKE